MATGIDRSGVRRHLPERRALGVDCLAVTTWVLAVAGVLHGSGVPAWLYYAAVAAGVAGYALLVAHAERLAERAGRDRRITG